MVLGSGKTIKNTNQHSANCWARTAGPALLFPRTRASSNLLIVSLTLGVTLDQPPLSSGDSLQDPLGQPETAADTPPNRADTVFSDTGLWSHLIHASGAVRG